MLGINFFIISHFITGAVSSSLGFIVLKKDFRSNLFKMFSLLAFSVALWSFSYSIWLIQDNYSSALFWARTLNLGATFIPVFYFHWVSILLKKQEKNVIFSYYIITFVFALFSYSGIYITNVKQIFYFPYWPQAGFFYLTFLFFGWLIMISHGLILLFNELKLSSGFRREQIKYVIWGSLIGFVGGSTNFPLMVDFPFFIPVGSPFVIAYPIVFGYTIIRHNLMDIKLVLRKSYVFISSFFTIAILISTLSGFVELFFNKLSFFIQLIILLATLLLYPKIQSIYYKIANKYFFTSLYDSQKLIADLSRKLGSTLDMDKIFYYISDKISESFHSGKIAFFIFDKKSKKIRVYHDNGFDIPERDLYIFKDNYINKYFFGNKPIIVDALVNSQNTKTKNLGKELNKFNIAIISPIIIKEKIKGCIIFGEKVSGDIYNSIDLQVIEIVTSQASIAIDNALLYEETKNFNLTLKKSIKKATFELRKANLELKKLDEAKSDFISIASHQLRTPLTIIKGYVSMLLEGNFGRLSIEEENSLRKVFESNERLIRLVENLLNVSRIESGRLSYAFEEGIDLSAIVKSVCEELKPSADRKNLQLSCQTADDQKFLVLADSQKLRQVVLNLADNAVKYTRSGSIIIKLSADGQYIKCSVKDSGMGFTQDDKRFFFKRFSRGRETSLVHTEGTGLGLFVAKTIISEHKGKIWAQSEGKGFGSEFIFIIPKSKTKEELVIQTTA